MPDKGCRTINNFLIDRENRCFMQGKNPESYNFFYQTISVTIRQQQRGDDKQARMAGRKDTRSVGFSRLSACRVHRMILL